MLNACVYDGLRTAFEGTDGAHPVGSSRRRRAAHHGLRACVLHCALSTSRKLARRQGCYTVISLCIGIGQGLAIVVERT